MLLTKQETAESYYNGTTQPLREQDKTLVFAFAEAIEAAVLEKLCAGVEMPEPFRKQGQQMAYDGDDKVFFDCFSAEQLQTAIAASRLKALEDAATEAERMTMYPGGRQEAPAHDTVWHAARAIRALKGETP